MTIKSEAECYRILGLKRPATKNELTAAYRDLAKVWHPDRFANDPAMVKKAGDKMREINEAYQWLKDARKARPRAKTRPKGPSPAPEAADNRWAMLIVAILSILAFLLGRSFFEDIS